MPNQPSLGRQAVVMGGSMAGLLATRVLSDFFDRVTLLERDVPPDGPHTRQGVPQGRHAHALLSRGEQILSRFFPGLTGDLVAGGAFCADLGAAMRWYQFDGYKRRHTWGHSAFIQTRPFLEWHVRRRVLALPNVEFAPGVSITGLQCDGDRITGVELKRAGEAATLPADLVVDCTGRGSATPRWLEALGFPKPPESAIEVNVGYSSRYYHRDPRLPESSEIVLVYPKPPAQRRASTLLPVEGDRWICTLAGWLGDHPSIEPDGFLEFARSLPAPDVYRIISAAEPLSDPVPHRFPANLRRHYERLARFPGRFVVLGDAVCSFNPVYGQGMTSAALQAEMLGQQLSRGLEGNLAHCHFREVSAILEVPWKLAAGEDFRYPEVRGPKSIETGLVNRYVSLVHRAVMSDTRVYGDFLRVMNLLDPPTILFRPASILRVLRAAMKH